MKVAVRETERAAERGVMRYDVPEDLWKYWAI